jgi:hypothetical protein
MANQKMQHDAQYATRSTQNQVPEIVQKCGTEKIKNRPETGGNNMHMSGFGAAKRARNSNLLQRQVGNSRINNLFRGVVRTKLVQNSPGDAQEQEADRVASQAVNMTGPNQKATNTGKRGNSPQFQASEASDQKPSVSAEVENHINNSRGGSQSLPGSVRSRMEPHFGEDMSGVRIHDDEAAHRATEGLGANAMTVGQDIYFNAGRYQPGTLQGDQLIAHELTHVRQQQGQASPHPQFDLMQTIPTILGGFEIEMTTSNGPPPQMSGWIRFLPDPNGPYSARIALIQVANAIDIAGRTAPAGSPVNWANVGAGEETGRNDLMTTGLDAAPPGWFVDLITANLPRGSSIEPAYLSSYGESAGNNEFGWLRSPTDLHPAMLWDRPRSPIDIDFDFETVAKGSDNQVVYGSLHWGFKIRAGRVQDEYAYTVDFQSGAFDEALERFRGYYAHEPVVIYFDTDKDAPQPGEDAKLADVPDYMNRYPDVMVEIDGYADERGPGAYNQRLSQRRAHNASQMLLRLGIARGRITAVRGQGETVQFAAGSDAGKWRANRRAMIRFNRTATTPIRMP